MQVLFSSSVHVHYGQVYVQSGYEPPQADLQDAFAGQVNGLCGAATPGWLFMVTGLHTGHVGFTVELHDIAPPLDDSWEEVVEVSFRPTAEPVLLMQWAGEASWPLEIEPMDLRARYCAWGMDEARQADTILSGEQGIDRYLLQFWPAPPRPIRCGSRRVPRRRTGTGTPGSCHQRRAQKRRPGSRHGRIGRRRPDSGSTRWTGRGAAARRPSGC